jgi:hypothetical protein
VYIKKAAAEEADATKESPAFILGDTVRYGIYLCLSLSVSDKNTRQRRRTRARQEQEQEQKKCTNMYKF